MYCGNNKTACTSQRQIAGAMLKLLTTSSYSDISVSALCKEAGISRQTFYSLFSSMDNVILYILQDSCCQIVPEFDSGQDASVLELLCSSYSSYISQHRDVLKLLVENDIVYLLYNSIFDTFNHCCCMESITEADRQYAAHFFAGGITGVVRQYCMTEPPQSSKVLNRQLIRLFGGDIFH